MTNSATAGKVEPPETVSLQELKRLAEEAVVKAEALVRIFYRLKLPRATIDFSLRGRCAGQARIDAQGGLQLRINLQLLAENLDDYLRTTIPHEVAHLTVNWKYRRHFRRPRPHGPEWQAVMCDCFGLEPNRCHRYQTTPARLVPRNYLYRCDCREHRLTRIMHNKIGKASAAACKVCKTSLRYIGKQE